MKQFYLIPLCLSLCSAASLAQTASSKVFLRTQFEQSPAPTGPKVMLSTSFEGGIPPHLSYSQAQVLLSPTHARTGQSSLLLRSQRRSTASITTALLPVEAHQQISATIHATYARKRKLGEDLLQVAGMAAVAYGQSQRINIPYAAEQPKTSKNQKPLPFIGAGLALSPTLWPTGQGRPNAVLRYYVYDADTALIASGQQSLNHTAKNNWQKISLSTQIPVKGFVQVLFESVGSLPIRVDDFSVQQTEPITASYAGGLAVRMSLQSYGGCGGDNPGPGFPGNPDPYPLDPCYDCPPYEPPYPDYPYDYDPNDPRNPEHPGHDPNYPYEGGYDPGGGYLAGGTTRPEIIPDVCNGLAIMIKRQESPDRTETAAFATTDGRLILLPTVMNTPTTVNVPFPYKDAEGRVIMSLYENSLSPSGWSIDLVDYSTGTAVAVSYDIEYGIHSHPVGDQYLSDVPSDVDIANMNNYPGMRQFIVNQDKVIEYGVNKNIISSEYNTCH